jgi:hypothetical protein
LPFDSFVAARAGMAGAIAQPRKPIGHVDAENDKLRGLIAEFEASAFHKELRVAFKTVN